MQTANRVAFNTVVQYIQLVLNVVIGLVSVRLILAALGKVDYGIYDVVGGTVTLLSFITTSLSQASMRFISVSIGKNKLEEIRKTFRICFWLHVSIAVVLAIIIEIVGLFLFDGFLDIPDDRIFAAKMIYHCVTLTLVLHIILTPYKALINSHEKYWYTSIIGILNSVLKLLIAIMITHWFSEKLIAYGVLLSLVTLIDFLLIAGYVTHLYKEQMSYEKTTFQEMRSVTGFVGWTLLDVLGSVVNRQGYAVMLNRFFGPITNATFALSTQLSGHMYSVSASAVGTMKPQIMKSFGAGDQNRMFRLSMTAGKIGFALMSVVCVPLVVMMPEILTLWLKDYPEGTVLFSRLMILACMAEQSTRGLVFANQAVGNIKWFSIIVSTVRGLAFPISWVFLWLGYPDYVAIIIFLICETLGSFSRVLVLSKISKFNRFDFYRQVLLKIMPPVLIAFIICILFYHYTSGWLGLLLSTIVTTIVYCVVVYYFGLTQEEKNSMQSIWNSITSKLKQFGKSNN